jgi:hypothetical protein
MARDHEHCGCARGTAAANFDGNIAIEYEYNGDNSVYDIAQCIGFVRGWAAARAR